MPEEVPVGSTGLRLVGMGDFLDRVLCRRTFCQHAEEPLHDRLDPYTGEFGYELLSHLPQVFAECARGDLGKTAALEGMEPFYFFNLADHKVVHGGRVWRPFPGPWASQSVHVRSDFVPGGETWLPPPYKQFFANDVFRFAPPAHRGLAVVGNKYRWEWRQPPMNFFDLQTLREVFSGLQREGYRVVYVRTNSELFQFGEDRDRDLAPDSPGPDSKDYGDTGDFEMLAQEFPSVLTLQAIVDAVSANLRNTSAIPRATLVNSVMLGLLANAEKYVAVQGGDSALYHYFCKEAFVYMNKACSAVEELRHGDLHWWHRLTEDQQWPWSQQQPAPCTTRMFLQPETLLSFLHRGAISREVSGRSLLAELLDSDEPCSGGGDIASLADPNKLLTEAAFSPRFCPHCASAMPERDCRFCLLYDSDPLVPDAALVKALQWLADHSSRSRRTDRVWADLGPVYAISREESLLQLNEKMADLGIQATIMMPPCREDVNRDELPWYVADVECAQTPEFDSLEDQRPGTGSSRAAAARSSVGQLLEREEAADGRLERLADWLAHLGALWDFLTRDDAPDVAVVFGGPTAPSSMDAQALIDAVTRFRGNVSSWVPRKTCKDEGWDLLCLGYSGEPEDSRNYADLSRGVQPLMRPRCQQAYAITRHGARVLLDAALPVQVSGAKLIMELTMSGQLRAFGPVDPFFDAEDRTASQSSSSSSTSAHAEGERGRKTLRTYRPRSAYGEVALDEAQVRDLLDMRFRGLHKARGTI